MGRTTCIALLCLLACAGMRGSSATRTWDGGSASIPVVRVESADPSFEIVMTVQHPGIEVPKIQHALNAYGRMNLTVWIRNGGRSQEMIEVKARFFDPSGSLLDATVDWTQVFVSPGEVRPLELLCAEEGAATFKVLLR
ncbi:hypothetical protein JXA88_04975 [Candidatus Fermentibacteria bacterium]|nr:hypothetical protein [Candidatus Fermentibacteria bacterium]